MTMCAAFSVKSNGSLPISEPLPAQNLVITDFTETSLIAGWDPPNAAQTDHTRYEAKIQVLNTIFTAHVRSTR